MTKKKNSTPKAKPSKSLTTFTNFDSWSKSLESAFQFAVGIPGGYWEEYPLILWAEHIDLFLRSTDAAGQWLNDAIIVLQKAVVAKGQPRAQGAGLSAITWHELAVEFCRGMIRSLYQAADNKAVALAAIGRAKLSTDLIVQHFAKVKAYIESKPTIEEQHVTTELQRERILFAAECTKPAVRTKSHDRDQYAYDQGMKGVPWGEIRRDINARCEWNNLADDQAVMIAAKKHAERHKLPPLPKRKRGRK